MWPRTEKLKREIDKRIDLGKGLLEFSGVEIKKNMRPEAIARSRAATSYDKLFALMTPFWDAYNTMLIHKADSEVSSASIVTKLKAIRNILSAE